MNKTGEFHNEKIEQVMLLLGCKKVRPLVFRHPEIDFDLDFTATHEDAVLLRLLAIFSEKGFELCKQKMRDLFEV